MMDIGFRVLVCMKHGSLSLSLRLFLTCNKSSFWSCLLVYSPLVWLVGSEGPRAPLLGRHTSLFPVKNQRGTNSSATHAGRPGVPGLGQGPWVDRSEKAWKVNTGPWA